MKRLIILVIVLNFLVSSSTAFEIPLDKSAHALGGGLMAGVAAYYNRPIQERFMLALSVGIAKEMYDVAQRGHADTADISATMVGWALTEVFMLLVRR